LLGAVWVEESDVDLDLNNDNDKIDRVMYGVHGIKQNPAGNQLNFTPSTK